MSTNTNDREPASGGLLPESKPHIIPCHANNYAETIAWIRQHNGHIEQIKVGPGNGDYILTVGWG